MCLVDNAEAHHHGAIWRLAKCFIVAGESCRTLCQEDRLCGEGSYPVLIRQEKCGHRNRSNITAWLNIFPVDKSYGSCVLLCRSWVCERQVKKPFRARRSIRTPFFPVILGGNISIEFRAIGADGPLRHLNDVPPP
jgi:hypothetical protein